MICLIDWSGHITVFHSAVFEPFFFNIASTSIVFAETAQRPFAVFLKIS